MAFKDSGSDDEMITDINVTPFVDVVLVLLILFMLAAPAVYQSAVRVQLPQAVTGAKVQHITLKYYLSEKGETFLEKDRVTAQGVQDTVKKALAADPRADAIIFADRRVAHGAVIEIIDSIKQGGIRDVALGVEAAVIR